MSTLAHTPAPPYYAVIFTVARSADQSGYEAMGERMVELAMQQPGFLGLEYSEDSSGGITVSYWQDENAIHAWKQQMDHREAQRLGRERWYQSYTIRVARVERAYGFER